MKTTNILLGFAALFVAVAGAFASNSVTPPHYINVQYAGAPDFTCTPVSACDDQTTTPCAVRVIHKNGTLILTGVPVYDEWDDATTCSDVVFTSLAVQTVSKTPEIIAVR